MLVRSLIGASEFSNAIAYAGLCLISTTLGGILGLVIFGRKRVAEGMVCGWLVMFITAAFFG